VRGEFDLQRARHLRVLVHWQVGVQLVVLRHLLPDVARAGEAVENIESLELGLVEDRSPEPNFVLEMLVV
jgi:hypothetical protein